MVRLQDEPIRPEVLAEHVLAAHDGAVVTFVGAVRDHNTGRRVLHLEYHAYPEMALGEMARIERSALETYDVSAVAIVHRTGRLEIGEASVAVAVAAPHRAAAFDAARWCIDTLKESAPIWKREHWSDGSDWSPTEQPIRPVVEPTRSRA